MLKQAGANGGAMIVNTASIAGKQPQGWLAAYSATKAGVIVLTEATAKEIAADGVRCTSICPGFVDTPMTEWIRGQVAQADMIRPEDVAEVVRCLLRLSPACMIPEVMMIRPADLQSAAGP
jgi:NAD(P)-dependent dehydrogenase (short-subunit alcohol dehydrogenase family)